MKPSEYPDSPFREMFEMWERRLDKIFDRISGPLHDMPAGSTSVSRENSDETPISYICPSPQDGEENIPLTHESIHYTSEGESFRYQCPSPDTQSEAAPQVTSESSSGSVLFACEIPPPNNDQTAFDISGVAESHCAPVLDEPRATQCPISLTLTSEDPNLHYSSMCSPNNVGREIEGRGDDSVACLSVRSLALDSGVTAHVAGPSPGEGGGRPVANLSRPISRLGPDLWHGPFVGTGPDSEGLKAQPLVPSFPKHGPDIMAFIRQFTSNVITPDLLRPQSVRHTCTSAVRMAQGREAYGRLRPVRRPWLC